jgi:hypothetical protein
VHSARFVGIERIVSSASRVRKGFFQQAVPGKTSELLSEETISESSSIRNNNNTLQSQQQQQHTIIVKSLDYAP